MLARLLPYGDSALLVEPADPAAVPQLLGAADAGVFPGVGEAVAGASTVLLIGTGRLPDAGRVAELIAALDDHPAPTDVPATHPAAGRPLLIRVRYDGPDLERVAAHAGCSVPEVVAAHTAPTYRVAVTGFAPGFGYLRGLPPELHCPRLTSPRPRVPAGAVGVAAGWTGVYPRSMPGGWNLLGTTETVMFDPDRRPPALLSAGASVRFVALE